MNCKQGDLAVIVKSWAGNEGKIVHCVRLATHLDIARVNFEKNMGAVWVVDTSLTTERGRQVSLALDCQIRPIRDNDGEDETLQWAPVPTKETA